MLKDKRGSVAIIFALCAMALGLLVAVVTNQVGFYTGKRKLQAAADMAALIIMRSGDVSDTRAKSIVAAQIGELEGLVVKVVRGRYTPDASKAAGQRFEAGATPYNAVQVDADQPTKAAMLSGMMSGTPVLRVSARAARRQTASIVVGSRLVRLEGGLSQALLNSVLGYQGKVTVMDYNALAAAHVDAVSFLQALNTSANINAATFEDVLDANVKVGQVVQALASTVGSPSVKTTLGKATPAYPNATFKLSDILDMGSLSTVPVDGIVAGQTTPLNVGEVLAGSAALSNGSHQVALNLSVMGLAGVTLDVGEQPQLLKYDAYAEPSTKVKTSQLTLTVAALGTLKVDVQLAGAEIEIVDISCQPGGTAQVTLKAVTEAAKVGVKPPLLPKLNLTAGSGETKTLVFSPADISAQTWKTTRSGLGLNVNGLSLTQKLLVKPVDDLLVALGLSVGEADVKVVAADCGGAGLVH